MEEKPVTLRIYPPSDNSNLAELVKATVSTAKAVFELARRREATRKFPGVPEHSPDLNLLRSKQLTDIGDYKITGLSIRRSLQDYPTIVRFDTGRRKDRPAAHMDDTRRKAPATRKSTRTTSFPMLKTVKTATWPDSAPDKAPDLAVYGLDNPLLTLQRCPCAQAQ